jgi:SAM-dependent methyltransferase
VIELGAGTGATTEAILAALPRHLVRYEFTDISDYLLARAAERLVGYDCLRFRRLDLDLDPSDQGFKNDVYDVVVAANVLHATRNVRRTLGRVRQLLAPGGFVVCREGTRPHLRSDLIFGLFKGWWCFEDVELRPSHPLISVETWTQLLIEQGFSPAVVLPVTADMALGLAHQSLFIARKAE